MWFRTGAVTINADEMSVKVEVEKQQVRSIGSIQSKTERSNGMLAD